MRRFGRRVAAATASRVAVDAQTRSVVCGSFLLARQGIQAAGVRSLSSAVSHEEGLAALEKAQRLMDEDDMEQAMGLLGVAAHADIPDAQYLLGSLLLNDEDDEDESQGEEDEEQRATKTLIRDAEANRQRSRRPDDAQDLRSIRKSARKAYKQYLLARKQKKQLHAAAQTPGSASVVQHATTDELNRAYGTTLELFLDPKTKLEPIVADGDALAANAGHAATQVDSTKGVEWLRRAADNSHRDAHVQLGNLCLSHDPPLAQAAGAWYTRVTGPQETKPHPDALHNLGVMFFDGVDNAEPPFPANKGASIPYFVRAAEVGDTSAQFFMGQLLHQGDEDLEIKPDLQSGLMLVEMAASKGHSGAQFYLAQLYRSGDEEQGLQADHEKFLKYLDEALQAADEDALFCMADIYFHGSDGFGKDLKQAHDFYLAAAEQENADAYCCLGALYYNGLGVKQNYKKAFAYYQAAADRHSMEAWKNLAEMYTMGRGVPRNESAAKAIIKMLKKMQVDEEADE